MPSASHLASLSHFLGQVSDVSDDVRRAAVLCLGFVLMGHPSQCPRIVSLLAESFNPHVRCAASRVLLYCFTAGIGRGGTWGGKGAG